MHPAARLQLARTIEEYRRWQMVDERDRSPAPGWWWGPALALREMPGALPGGFAQLLGLPEEASPAAAAELFLAALAGQTHLPWPEEFPGRYRPMAEQSTEAS